MTDLIQRLRDCANEIGSFETWQGDYGICHDAADRIEELEATCWRMQRAKVRAEAALAKLRGE